LYQQGNFDMPVLHQYRETADYYAKSHIKGAIVTFQLTKNGQQKLIDSGLEEGSRFPLHLLSDLLRSGDAYTGGSGVGIPEEGNTGQRAFDFPEDEQAEKLLPSCSVTGSYEDLHLVVWQQDNASIMHLLSPPPRRELQKPVLLSIPLSLLNLKSLNHLQQMNKLPDNAVVTSLRLWFAEHNTVYWERWRQLLATKSQQLGLLPDEKPSLF
jgi:hypothetical protein